MARDVQQQEPSTWWLRRLAGYLVPHRRKLITAFVAAMIVMATTALLPLIIRSTVDRAVVDRRDSLAMWLTLLVGVGLVRTLFAGLRRYTASLIGYEVEFDFRRQIFDHLQRLDFARHDQLETGQLVSRTNGDLALLYELLILTPLMTSNLILFLVSIGIMLALSPLLALVMALTFPALLFGAVRMSKVIYPSSWDALQWSGEVAGVVEESVSGVRVVKGFGQERRQLDRLVRSATRLFGSRMRNARMTARYAPALNVIPALGQVAILGLGGWLVIEGRLTIGTFLAFQSYLAQMIWPVRMLANMIVQAQQARAAAERIFDVLDATPIVEEREGAAVLARPEGRVTLDGVTFGYDPAHPVLHDVDLEIEPGERVALVGSSGSGKSTLALLVPRLYDVQAGTVRIDGVDVRDLSLTSLRRQVGVVFEESFLFSDSVRSNIAYGRPDASHEDIVAAARAAAADGFIAELPDGYDTVVGERGLTLSGGQRQRIALARALLTNPEILILDDATSSIDVAVEEQIHGALAELMRDRTTILIAHRRSTLALASRIVVLDEGRIVDTGTHEELLVRCTRYRELLVGPDGGLPEPESVPLVRTDAAWVAPEALAADLDLGQHLSAADELDDQLVSALRALPPIADEPDVDLAREVQGDPAGEPFLLRNFLKPFRMSLLAGFGLVALDSLVNLAGPSIIRHGVDDGIARSSTSGLLGATLLFLGCVLAGWFTFRALILVTTRTAQRVLYALRVRVFAQLQRLGLDFYEKEMGGRIMTRMTSDIEALQQLLQNGLINALAAVVTFIGSAGILLVMNSRLGLATIVSVLPLVALSRWFQKRSDVAFLAAREKVATVNAQFQEGLSGVRVAQAYAREARNGDDFEATARELLDARRRTAWLGSVYFPLVEFLSTAVTAVVLGYGASLIAEGSLTTGALVAFVLYLGQVFWPIQQLSQVFETYQQAKAAMTKIRDLLTTRVTVPEPDVPVPLPTGRATGAIALDTVRFAYNEEGAEALSGVDLTIVPGQTIALVGETGAGKSTIVKLVARFYDATSGVVRIDGTPLPDLDPHDYRRNLGYVPQEAYLFVGTIRDNIAFGRPDASDEEVEATARAVGAHDFIARLRHGYLTPVTERGRSLSAGQRQLIALARALLVDPPILLLDEATANLDLATEARVSAAMGLVSQGRTTLLIAHRLQTAARADRILVIDHGRIVEQGDHEELLALGGRYAELWWSWAAGNEDTPDPSTSEFTPA